jgi:polar amino acid transport system substrate-binding protein
MAQQFISPEALRQAIRTRAGGMAHISHDLRTSLNVIIGFAGLMLDEVPGQINKEQRQCLNDILNSARQLLHLINDACNPSDTGGNDDNKAEGKDHR